MNSDHICQNERWERNYQLVRQYIFEQHRLPSRHRLEDHRMLNWIKYNRKRIASGLLSADKQARFEELMASASQFHRVNQHAYVLPPSRRIDAEQAELFGE